MNKKAQKSAALGFSLVIIFFLLMITAFGLIDPFKEALDDARDTTSLNCPGTLNHNATAYTEQTTLQKQVKRPTCFVTGISLIYFIGSFLIAAGVWVIANWRKLK